MFKVVMGIVLLCSVAMAKLEEKTDVISVFEVPQNQIVSDPERIQEAAGSYTCVSWRTSEQCNTQQICETVCAGAAGGIGSRFGAKGAMAGSAMASQPCQQVCKMVPQCRTTQICERYDQN